MMYRTFAVLGCFAFMQLCASSNVAPTNETQATQNSVVKLDDVFSIVVDKDEQLDVRSLLTQISNMIAANSENVNNVDAENLKLSMLQAKVFERLLYVAAKKIGLHNTPEIKERIDALSQQLIVRAYVSKAMSDRIKPADTQKMYTDLVKTYPKPGIEIGHILVKDENTAKEVIAALDRGEKFGDVAKKYSIAASKEQGGKEDLIPVDALPPQMAELKNLEIGQYSKKAFPSNAGFHVVCVLDRRNVDAPKFEQVQRSLEGELFRIELEKLTQTLLKTVKIVARNEAGKEIDIMPLLTKKIVPVDVNNSALTQGANASSVNDDKKVVTNNDVKAREASENKDSNVDDDKKSNGQEDHSNSVVDEKKKTNEVAGVEHEDSDDIGVIEKIFRWVKGFF